MHTQLPVIEVEPVHMIINPRHACAARVTGPHSCVSVCLSVTTLAKASLGYTPT